MALFTVAGVSTLNGVTKVRYANDLSRVKVLLKGGHTDIELFELPSAMDKGGVVKYLLSTELMDTDAYAEAIQEANEKYNAPLKINELISGDIKIAKKAPKKTEVSLDDLKARAIAKVESDAEA